MCVATEKKKVSAYLDETLKQEAEALAQLESRSLSSLIEVLLKEAVAKAKADGRM